LTHNDEKLALFEGAVLQFVFNVSDYFNLAVGILFELYQDG